MLDAAIESQVGKKALDDTDRAIVEAALNALAPRNYGQYFPLAAPGGHQLWG